MFTVEGLIKDLLKKLLEEGVVLELVRAGADEGFDFPVMLLRQPGQEEGGLVVVTFTNDFNPGALDVLLPLLTADFFKAAMVNEMFCTDDITFELCAEVVPDVGQTVRLTSALLSLAGVRLYWSCDSKKFLVLE